MKLFLSSFRLGSDPHALRELVGRSGRAGVVLNALDVYADGRPRHLEREFADIAAIGFTCEELDLRTYFSDFDGLCRRLRSLDLLWVVGGNSFALARAMTQARFREASNEGVNGGQLTYAGYSAGACVVAPDLEGIHLMDEPGQIPDGYPANIEARTLNWVPWRIVPHWRSNHPESSAADLAVEHLLATGLAFRALLDGQAIVIDGGQERVVGTTDRGSEGVD